MVLYAELVLLILHSLILSQVATETHPVSISRTEFNFFEQTLIHHPMWQCLTCTKWCESAYRAEQHTEEEAPTEGMQALIFWFKNKRTRFTKWGA